MGKLQKILFIVCILSYLLTKFLIFMEFPVEGFAKNHLADLLCMPIILSIIQLIIQKFNLHHQQQKVPIIAVLILTIYWSFYFEYYLPKQSGQYIGDKIDVLMYFSGSILFIICQRMSNYSLKSQTSLKGV